ncbi:hypothetical protein AABM38_20415 [Heyndrickxia sp. MSNUG]|uniref:hypothetical protein n=1 Tax=Heyndrickxia sp. MSNUG TaxID=3136677 RepID=UPI003C30781C
MEEKDMLNSHEVIINENILPRLKAVEDVTVAVQQEMANLKNDLLGVQKGQKELEVTLLKEGQLNRQIMTENKELTNKLLTHVLAKDEKETQAEIDERKAENQSKIETRKAKWELIGKISVTLLSSGSIIYLIFEAVTK